MSSENNSKKVIGYDITMWGSAYGDGACGNCVDGNTFFIDKKSTSKQTPIYYSFNDIDSPRAKKVIEDNKLEAKPWIEACKIYEDGEMDCSKKVNRFHPDDWKELN